MNLPLLVVAFLLPAHLVPPAPGDSSSVRSDSAVRAVPLPRAGSILRTRGASSALITDSGKYFLDYRTLSDLVGLEPGVVDREFGQAGRLPDLSIGGVDGRGIAWLRDGVVLNDPLFGLFDPNLAPAEEADRVEIVTGTSAFLYGLNAAGGAVNVVTRNKRAAHPWTRLRYSEAGDSYSLVDGSLSEDIIRGLNVTAGAQHVTFGPRYVNSGYDAWNGRFRTRYSVSQGLECFFSWNYAHTELGLNGGVNTDTTLPSLVFDERQAVVRNADAYEKRTREDVQAGAAFRFPADTAGVTTVTAYYSSDLREFRDEENRVTPPPNGITVVQNGRSDRAGLSAGHSRTIGVIALDAGAEVRSERVLVTPATAARTATPFDLRARAVFSPISFVRLSPGVRLDRTGEASALGWGVDLALPLASPFEFFGGYSVAFRFPTAEERYGLDTILASTLDDGSIECHRLVEAGMRLTRAGWLRPEAAFFQRTIDGPFLVQASPPGAAHPYTVVHGNQVMLRGVRGAIVVRSGWLAVEGTGQFLERFYGEGGFSTGDRGDGAFPKWTADAGAYYRDTLFGAHLDLKCGFRGRYWSAYGGRAFNDQALLYLPAGPNGIPAYPAGDAGTVDFLLIARIGDAHIHFTWENLGGKEYFLVAGYPMQGRQIRLGVTWEFLN